MNQRTACADCSWHRSGPAQPHYDHVHRAPQLPRERRTESHILARGHAVGMAGPRRPQSWTFFHDLEPALAFGRAGWMSADVSSYGVYAAAREIRYDTRARLTSARRPT